MLTLPDRTSSWFGWRELVRLNQDTLGCYQDWRAQFGPALRLRIGPQQHCIFYTSEAVGQVLKHQASRFRRYPQPIRVLAQWNGRAVTILEGQEWLRQRRLLSPAFQPQHIGKYRETMVRAVEKLCQDNPSPWVVSPLMVALTLRILSATIFGLGLDGDLEELRLTIQQLGEIAMVELFLPFPVPQWLPIPFARRKRAVIAWMKRFVEGLIAERMAQGLGSDLLSSLLAASDEGGKLSVQQVRDEAMTLVLAGHDTTAAGLSWLLYCLARHPEVAERVAREDLAYTEQVVKETLRLYPPAPAMLLRQALQDVEIAGYQVKKGWLVHLPTYVIHRDPAYFPEPERFDPDRFAPEVRRPDFAYFPFGAGPRVCLGQSFAMLEMTLAAATLMRHYVPRLAPDTPPSLGRDLRLTLWPAFRGLTLHLERRKTQDL